MYLRIVHPKHKKKLVRVGDAVRIVSMPGDVPQSRVDPNHVPRLVAIRRTGRHSKSGTVKYTDTEDGQSHIVELPASNLMGVVQDGTAFDIGDHVELIRRGHGVLPAVGSKGVVLSGGGNTENMYTVTFEMTHAPEDGEELSHSVTVTQNCIPDTHLKLLQHESLESLSSSSSSSSSDDDDDHDDEASSEDDDLKIGQSTRLSQLRHHVPSDVYVQLLQMCSLEELEELSAACMSGEPGHIKSVKDALQLIYST